MTAALDDYQLVRGTFESMSLYEFKKSMIGDAKEKMDKALDMLKVLHDKYELDETAYLSGDKEVLAEGPLPQKIVK